LIVAIYFTVSAFATSKFGFIKIISASFANNVRYDNEVEPVKCDLSKLFPGGILGVIPSTSLQNACLPPPSEKKEEQDGCRGIKREREMGLRARGRD